jgi:hypothetical protein
MPPPGIFGVATPTTAVTGKMLQTEIIQPESSRKRLGECTASTNSGFRDFTWRLMTATKVSGIDNRLG